VYVKCFFAGATYSQVSQTYDGFAPDFAGIGGVNFVAYMKPGYDEFRFWNGTSWSAANTNLKPFYKQAANLGTRFEVAIPWSAMIPGGGIPDSVKVVCYQTNGNSGNIFSYAQLPKLIPAGAQAAPTVGLAQTIRVKNVISVSNPFRFNKTKTGQQSGQFLKVYNPGNANLLVGTAAFLSGNPGSEGIAFSVSVQSATTILPKQTSQIYVEFAPQTALITYDATAAITNNSPGGSYPFKVIGAAVGEPNIEVKKGNDVVSPTISILFGETIPENTQQIVDLQVNSTGQDTLEISPVISANPTVFEVVSTSRNSLPPGENASVKVRFKPQSEGSYTGKLNMGANLSESTYRIDLQATVVAGAGGLLEVIHIPNRMIKVDGNASNQWLPSEKIASGTTGLDWYASWNADSLYLARIGGNNAEPQIINMKASYPGQTTTSQSFAYDGITTNFTSQGGMNFIAYLKNNYNEFRTCNDVGVWSSGNTTLSPKYSTQGTSAHMEVAIPWSATTQSNGIPDSIKLVLFQGNGNAGNPFVYGQVPASLTAGGISVVLATNTIRKVIAQPITESEPFDFGGVVVGSNSDTTLLVYNKGTSSITSITPIDLSNPLFSALTNPAQNLVAKTYTKSKIRFSPSGTGNQVAIGSISGQSGPGSLSYSFKVLGKGIAGPTANVLIRIGQTVFQPADTLKFGNHAFGLQKDSTVWIKSTGTDTLRITNSVLTGASYSISTNFNTKIAPGDSTKITIRFSSSAPAGIKSGKLNLVLNVPGLPSFLVNITGTSTIPVVPQSTLEIRHIANNLINTSGAISPSQLQPKFLLSDDAGIKWYATWDTAHLYVVKIGGNRAQPQIVYIRASYPGAVFTDSPTFYDGFHPNFTGIGGINFSAYFKETAIPYDEFRNWNGTLWLAPDQNLQPLYGNQGADVFAVRIPWNNITQGNGVPDSLRMVLYQTTGSLANFSAYGQSPVGLPSGNAVTPPINLSHSRKIITRLPNNSEFDFGNVAIGNSVDTCFLFQNEGPAGSTVTLNGPSTLTGPNYSSSLQTTAGTVIPSKKWGVMKVRFTPSGLGNSAGFVTANASFDNPPAPYKVNFKGAGVPVAQAGVVVKLGSTLVANGSTTDVGTFEIGTQMDTTLRIFNTGQDTLRINGIGGLSPGWSLVTLPSPKIRPGDSSKFTVRKNVVVAGINFGQFSFGTNAPGLTSFNFSLQLLGDSALSWFPPFPTINDSITITLKTALGNKALKDINPVFIHTGVITSGPTGTNWENVQGSFNVPADSVKLQNLGPNKQQIKFRIRDFYNLTGNPTVHRLGMVFRNDVGSKVGKTRTEGDFFIPVNPNPATAQIRVRTSGGEILSNGDTIQFGILPFGSVHDTSVTIKNTGVVPLVFSLINVASFSFSQVGTTALTVAVGDSITVNIQLNVNGNGPLEGFLNLVSNASNSPTLLVNLVATGVVSNRPLEIRNGFDLYPNPSSGLLFPQFSDQTPFARFKVEDLAGRTQLQGNWKSGDPINISVLPPGIWILVMETEKGMIRRKVVRE